MHVQADLGAWSEPALVVPATQRCSELEATFRSRFRRTQDLQSLDQAARRTGATGIDGCRVALDDMGAGSTSLRYMSAVKIHGLNNSFIGGMLHNQRDYTVVKLLIRLRACNTAIACNHVGRLPCRVSAEK